jgi:hypothetical protein
LLNKLKASWLAAADYLVGSRHSGDGSRLESRVRRLLIWVPLAGTALLLLWTHGVREPRADYLISKNQDLIQLEEAITTHRLRVSDQQFADLQIRLRDAELFILPDAATTGRLVDQVVARATENGWSLSTAAAVPNTSEPVPGLPELTQVFQTLQLEYTGNTDLSATAGLLGWLEYLDKLDQRIDVSALNLESDSAGQLRLRLRLGFVQRSRP